MFGKKKKDMKKKNIEAARDMSSADIEDCSKKVNCGRCCAGRNKAGSKKK